MSENPYREKLETALVMAAVEGIQFVFEQWADDQSIEEKGKAIPKTVNAQFLRDLCLAILPEKSWPDGRRIHPKGVSISGIHIDGTLDFEGCTLEQPLTISDAEFSKEHGIVLRHARTRAFSVHNSTLSFVKAQEARVDGSFSLKGTTCSRGVNLQAAHIYGQFNCSGASFEGKKWGLCGDRVQVGGSVFLNVHKGQPFTAKGIQAVRLVGARISGLFNCRGAQLDGTECGLFADRIWIGGGINIRAADDGKIFTARGREAVRLLGAHIGGQFSCRGAQLEGEEHGLNADGLRVDDRVSLDTVDGQSFTARGKIAVRLLGAHIGGQFGCSGAQLEGSERGLSADGLRVDDRVILCGGFAASGQTAVSFKNADLRNCLELNISRVRADPTGTAISLEKAEIAGRLSVFAIDGQPDLIGDVDLSSASVDVLDDTTTSWPTPDQGRIVLDGFRYRHLRNPHHQFRSEWLRRQPPTHLADDFRPQPWEQLAKVYRESGYQDEAKRILTESMHLLRRQRFQRTSSSLKAVIPEGLWERCGTAAKNILSAGWHWFLGLTIAYGYRPLRAFLWVGAIWIIGGIIFQAAHLEGMFAPSQAAANSYMATKGSPLPGYPDFNPYLYSLDVSLPIVDLHQEAFWEPSAPACSQNGGATYHAGYCASDRAVRWRWHVEVWRVGQILAGWVLISLAVAGLAGIVKKD